MDITIRLLPAIAALAVTGAAMHLPLGAQAADGDAAAGKTVFQRQCATCHIDAAEGPRRLGPTLFGLIGRKTGAVEGFRYTEANRNAGFAWTPEKLDQYLRNPRELIPGTNMAFAGIRSDADRANVVAYINSLK
ncbi:MAG: c-type cytochrome [Alphaproteobacteria bacterium]